LIRKAVSADIEKIVKIERDCFSRPWSEKSFEMELEKKNCEFLVFESDADIAGYIIFWYIIDEAELANIAVAEKYRKKGIAAKLLQFCVDKHPDISSIFLEVEETNSGAICLYRKFGFEVSGKIKDYYGRGRDALRMAFVK
jgi:ribosomal-protein-alanine N-acetyltransferase